MPYRRLSKRQLEIRQRKAESMRLGKAAARLRRPQPAYPPIIPDLRREVTVRDFDGVEPITHVLRFYKTKRIDSFRIEADGVPWKTCGWSEAMAWLRKAFPRVPSPRSTFWQNIEPSPQDVRD